MKTTTISLAMVALLCAWAPSAHAEQAANNSAQAQGSPVALQAPELSPCKLGEINARRVSAQCGRFVVPEDYDNPDGRLIELKVALLPATGEEVQSDAITFLAGGPGQAATEAYPQMAGVMAEARRDRDIVLVDQRGTGSSNKLACQYGDGDPFAEFSGDIDFADLARECLEQIDGDPRFYNTYVAMRDLEELRKAMGYDALNLIGVSYGTRAAMTYVSQYPASIRSVILDGVAPMQTALGFDHAENLDRALGELFALCAADEACNNAFGDVDAKLRELLERTRGEAVTVAVTNPRSGERNEIPVDLNVLRAAVRLLAYSPETASLLPLLIHDAWETGSYERFAGQAMMVVEGLDEALARGMEMSVMCAEDVPWYQTDAHSDDQSTVLGRIIVDGASAQCSVWPIGVIPEGSKQPLVSDKPVLLLSGELDPVTPPSYGEIAAETLSNSLHLVAPGQGHNVLPRGCAPKLATQFIAEASVAELDGSCLEVLGPSPFFTSFAGPQP